ncbi:MAG: RimK family alpha-L-glutamate ligase [Flavobacteriaceae bacterium]|nr:RimK family alpha-L-glutamate ligase [Flavobacteriaceae bacterium]
MTGWILQKEANIKTPSYETLKLLATGAEHGIDLKLLDAKQIEIIVTREDRKSVLLDNQSTKLPDFIFPRMGAHTSYFALAVMRHLERLGVYCINGSVGIETVKDKLFQMQILAENFPVPKTMLAKFPVDARLVEKQFKFPVIVKALSGMQGSGVFLSHDAQSFEDLSNLIMITNQNAEIIIQEFISASRGKDLRVFVIGDKVVGCMERYATDNSFKANFSRGGGVRNFELTPEIEELSLAVAKEVGLEIAGVDLLFDKDGFKICEVNSSPGFRGMEQATGKNIAIEIISHIKNKVENR